MFMRFERMGRLKSFEVPTVLKHGIGAAQHTGEEVKNLGVSKVLLVTDPGVKKVGLIDPVVKSLKEAQIEVVIFDQVEPNPSVHVVINHYLVMGLLLSVEEVPWIQRKRLVWRSFMASLY